MGRKYAISEFQKPLQACRRLLQLPQFYYPVQDKGQNARRVVLKSFIAIAIEKIMLQSLLLEGTNALAQIMQTVLDRLKGKLTLFRTDSCEIIYPVQDREDENHTLSRCTSLYRPYKGVPPPPFPHRACTQEEHSNLTVLRRLQYGI